MSDLPPLNIGEEVKYRDGAYVYPATVMEDVDDGFYRIAYKKNGVFTTECVANRLDLYRPEDIAALIEDLYGVKEDAEALIDELERALVSAA